MNESFSISIMMHPKRVQYRDYLLSKLGDVPIIMDRGKKIWDTARRAWLSYDPKKKFHLVIQDDVLICKDFQKKVEELLQKEGTKYVYSLFYMERPWSPVRMEMGVKGMKEGRVIWRKLQWGQAVIFPTRLIKGMIEFCDKMDNDADDERLKEFLFSKRIRVYYPMPSLVEHRGGLGSLQKHTPNDTRQAQYFIDDCNREFAALTYTTGNLGDDIQSLAAMQFLPGCKHFVDRDKIGSEERSLKLIGNGWWINGNDFPPKENIKMFPISMHIRSHKIPLDWFRENQPIGCRDLHTKDFLERNGIEAYFSGCLSFTFPLCEEKRENRIVLVDVAPEHCKELESIKGVEIKVLSHAIPEEIRNLPERKMELARERLNLYKKSRLVITNRLHVAFPCIAMGTPVILLRPEYRIERLSGYNFIPIHESIPFQDILDKDFLIERPVDLIDGLRNRVNTFVQNA